MAAHPTAHTDATTARARTTVQKAALAVGVVFLVVGVLGFVPGITTNYDSLGAAGHESEALLLGIFQVSILHNLVHLLFGVAGVLMARRADSARTYLLVGGAIYLVLWLYGRSSTRSPARTSSRSTTPTTGCTSSSASA